MYYRDTREKLNVHRKIQTTLVRYAAYCNSEFTFMPIFSPRDDRGAISQNIFRNKLGRILAAGKFI